MTESKFFISGKDYYKYNSWRQSNFTPNPAWLSTADPTILFTNLTNLSYRWSDDFYLKGMLAAKGGGVALTAWRQALAGIVVTTLSPAVAANFNAADVPASDTPKFGVMAHRLQLQPRYCTLINPAINAVCQVLCGEEGACDATVTTFCTNQTITSLATTPTALDAHIVGQCSCLVSAYGTWITAELNAQNKATNALLQSLTIIPCFDGGQCNTNGYQTQLVKQQAHSCPQVCSHTFIVESNVHPRITDLQQSCSISAHITTPTVIRFKQKENGVTKEGVAIIKNNEYAYLSFTTVDPAFTRMVLPTAPPPSPPSVPPLTLSRPLLIILIGGGVTVITLLILILVWWFH